MNVNVPPSVLDAPTGTLVYTLVGAQLTFYVRVGLFDLSQYPRNTSVDFRLASWQIERVLPVAMILRLAHRDTTTFDAWIDIGTPVGLRVMQALSSQHHVDVHLVTTEIVRSFHTQNPARASATQLVRTTQAGDSWSRQEFQKALDRMNRLYPTPESLWRSVVTVGGR